MRIRVGDIVVDSRRGVKIGSMVEIRANANVPVVPEPVSDIDRFSKFLDLWTRVSGGVTVGGL